MTVEKRFGMDRFFMEIPSGLDETYLQKLLVRGEFAKRIRLSHQRKYKDSPVAFCPNPIRWPITDSGRLRK